MIAITIFIAGFPRFAARKSAPAISLRLAPLETGARRGCAIQGACQLPQCSIGRRIRQSEADSSEPALELLNLCADDEILS
jgi:hypothetical protein